MSALFAANAYTLTGDRIVATAAALIALAAAVAGGLALRRPAGRSSALALAAGVVGVVVGALVVAGADGGPGTGNGIVGGYAAVALGLTAILLGALARVRKPRRGAAGPPA
ncbi:DUF6223 family protein [Actinoplanes sp. DH11]|uniref:DUF6223 family protein n=1 Tax=Actinoplanes sp. DH11 TaxID=2857011 RepID=UPI001E56A5BE|nr:DUF6223 family protein [Actinoplanes sp. DH11]